MKKYKIIVLGGGMVGSTIAKDLKEEGYEVVVADRDELVKNKLDEFKIGFIKINFLDKSNVIDSIKDFDLVVGAVPGFLGYDILELVLSCNKNIVDISFMPENSMRLDDLAKRNNVIAITDAGIAPGLSNLIFGRKHVEYDILDTAKCYVGGLPQNPKLPWQYKSVFSPIDVIEEYTRPARMVENGKIIIKPAMSEIESVVFKKIGKLDAFNSDGLRSLVNMPINNMVEKTLRFNGHIQKIIKLRDQGLFEKDKIEETSNTLISDWKTDEDDFDQTLMRLEFKGIIDNKESLQIYNLHDYYDKQNKISSMSRTTGFTCTAVINILVKELFKLKGVFNLEKLGENSFITSEILKYLSKRNVKLIMES